MTKLKTLLQDVSGPAFILKIRSHSVHLLVSSFACVYSFSESTLFIPTSSVHLNKKKRFNSLWNHWLPPDLQCLFLSFRTDYLLGLNESQIGLGILSRPQSVESTLKELFSVTVFIPSSWDLLWETSIVAFLYTRGNQEAWWSTQKNFLSNN